MNPTWPDASDPGYGRAPAGRWWPLSWDPAELPGLILALSARFGRVQQMTLRAAAWNSQFHRLAVGLIVVRIGWFTSLDPAVAIATTDGGDQVDILVVPPATPEGAGAPRDDRQPARATPSAHP